MLPAVLAAHPGCRNPVRQKYGKAIHQKSSNPVRQGFGDSVASAAHELRGSAMAGFPERLKAARTGLGLTQEQLAFELNVTKASISAWENGREGPGFRLLPAIHRVLGVSLDFLICGEGGEAEPTTSAPEKLTTRNETEAELLRAFRRLPARRRKALLEMID